jgi:hypothetical protein
VQVWWTESAPSEQTASRVEFASFLSRLAFLCAQDYAWWRIWGEAPERSCS